MSLVIDAPDGESAEAGSPGLSQSVTRYVWVEAAGVAAGVSGGPDEHADVVRKTTMAAPKTTFTTAGYATFPYMLASRRSTRSSTFANGSLHRTVRCA